MTIQTNVLQNADAGQKEGKAIIFGGAMQVAVRNLRASTSSSKMDMNIVRGIVPMALAGTVFGIFYIFFLPEKKIYYVVLLTLVCVCVCCCWGVSVFLFF